MAERRNRFEVWAEGIDEGLQGVGGDPWNGIVSTGLRIPNLATPDVDSRYLFMLCGFELGERVKATIRGWRQLLTLGVVIPQVEAPSLFVEKEVDSSVFRFPDGNASYSLTHVDPDAMNSLVVGFPGAVRGAPNRLPVPNFAWRFAESPALLWETCSLNASGFYTDLIAYKPPNLGRPIGNSVAHLKVIHDLRTNWRTHGAWTSLDLEVEGPGFYALWASVRQTAGVDLSPLATQLNNVPCGLCDYQFVANFPPVNMGTSGVRYWRVGGALDVEIHEDASATTCRSGR